MSLLTIASIDVSVAEGTWKENEPTKGGARSRSYAGNLRSTVRWTKRSWQGSTIYMVAADVATLKAAVVAGSPVTVAGDLIGSSISAIVTVGETTEVNVNGGDGLGVMYIVAFTIETV